MIVKIKLKSQIFVFILAVLHFFMLMLNETGYITCKISKELADTFPCTTGFTFSS